VVTEISAVPAPGLLAQRDGLPLTVEELWGIPLHAWALQRGL